MNVLLINPPIRERFPAYIQPIGLGIVANMLRHGGHEVKILDLNAIRPQKDAVEDLLPDEEFGMVGCGGLITTYKYLHFLVPVLREKYPKSYIVIGGGGITSAPDVYMGNLRPDFGVIGEGEYTALELATRLERGLPWDKMPGIVYTHGGKMIANPPRPVENDLDKFPWQAFDLIDIEHYITNVKHDPYATREIAIIATRGCPMHCNFCYHIFGKGVRYRSVGDVLAEMQYLMTKYGAQAFAFPDECMTARKSWIVEFCNGILERGWKIGWSCYSRVDTADEETMALMAKAGCNYIGFGLESGSQKMLDLMGKRVKLDRMRWAVETARKYFPQVGGTLIFGYPGETDETLDETVKFLADIRHLQNFFQLAAYPGTKVFEENKGRILAKFGTMHNFLCSLDDAGLFSINLTGFLDEEYHKLFRNMLPRVRQELRKTYERIEVWCAKEAAADLIDAIEWVQKNSWVLREHPRPSGKVFGEQVLCSGERAVAKRDAAGEVDE